MTRQAMFVVSPADEPRRTLPVYERSPLWHEIVERGQLDAGDRLTISDRDYIYRGRA